MVPHLIHGYLAHLSPQPTNKLTGSAVFVGLTVVTNRHTYRQTDTQEAASLHSMLVMQPNSRVAVCID